jgi:hypothetical protein
MTVKYEWIESNLTERLSDKSLDFSVKIKKTKPAKLSFEEASKDVCLDIQSSKKKLFMGLSGGIDSEYVFRFFHKMRIEVIPIIVCTSGNIFETPIAFNICKELNVSPIVLNYDEKEFLNIYYHNIHKKLNSRGFASTASLVAGKYAKDHGGVFIKSEHLLDDKDGTSMELSLNEWDFYNDALIGLDYTYYFFLHTPEIAYSMISQMDDTEYQRFKCNLYNIPYRDKIRFDSFSPLADSVLKELASSRKIKPKTNCALGSKEEFILTYFI